MAFLRAPKAPEGTPEPAPRTVVEGGRVRDRTAGAGYTEKALLAKQLAATEELIAAQQETNRLLAELLAQGRPRQFAAPENRMVPMTPGRHGQ